MLPSEYIRQFLFLITFGLLEYLIFFNFSENVKNRGFEAYNFTNLTPKISGKKLQTSPTRSKKIYPPGVVTVINNGLGNQLFRVASSYALARRLNVPLFWIINQDSQTYITSKLRDPRFRAYTLDAFELTSEVKINLVQPQAWENVWRRKTARYSKYNCINFFFDRVNKTVAEKELIYLGDFCHSEKYFEEYSPEIKDLLKVKKSYLKSTSKQFRKWKNEIGHKGTGMNATSSAIHIRRGDYLERGNNGSWPTPFSFYTEAISKMVETNCNKKVNFFIFSDDIDYVKKNFNTSYQPKGYGTKKTCTNVPEFIYVSPEHKEFGAVGGLTSIEEFILMTLCENIIISNSSFSWWAAYLNGNEKKIVLGPTFHPKFLEREKRKIIQGFRTFMLNYKYPKTWITLDPYNGTGL